MSSDKPECVDHREEVWSKLCQELGGEFVNEPGWRHDKVRIQHADWTVTLDFGSHRGYRSEALHTRFYAPVARSGFRMRIFPQELFHSVAVLAGMQDIRVGDKAFDRAFVLQASEPEGLKKLFAEAALRDRVRGEPSVEITLREPDALGSTEVPEGLDVLILEVPLKVEDGARLRRLFDTFSQLLQGIRDLQSGC